MNQKEDKKSFGALPTIALIVVWVGAAVSLSFMFYAGRQNKSVFLMALFSGWVLSPFAALVLANVISKPWSVTTRITLYILMLVIPLVSAIGYSGALGPIGPKPAFVFLVTPLISLVVIAIGIAIASVYSKR